MNSTLNRRNASLASFLAVALVASGLLFFAVRSDGQVVHDADLNDGGVWVTSDKEGKFAKLNKPIQQLDTGVTPVGTGLDVLQDGAQVLGITASTNQLLPINPRTGLLDESGATALPAAASSTGLQVFVPGTADLRGGTVAVIEPRTGKLWAQRVKDDDVSSLPDLVPSVKPRATVGPVAAVAVGVDGAVHAVSGETGTVVTLPATADGFGKPVTTKIDVASKAVDITAVGSQWVVFDAATGALWVQGQDKPVDSGVSVPDGGLAYAALQAPGPDSAVVGIEDPGVMHLVGLSDTGDQGGVAIGEEQAENVTRMVTRPVRLGSCVHAAWAEPTKVFYGADCGGAGPDGERTQIPAVTLEDIGEGDRRDGVRLRTNRGQIVLNDVDTGALWDLDSKPIKIDNWEDLTPPQKADDDSDNKDQNLIDEASLPQPPKATPDNLRVRPGRTSKLHVLDNDTDAKGSILAIAPGDVTQPSLGGVTASVAADGQSIDVAVPADPGGGGFTFDYQVNNGTAAKKSQARVTVTIVADSVQTAPRLRPGTATLAKTVYPVVVGGRLPVQVVGDWRDGESDPLSVESVDATSTVDGLGRLNVSGGTEKGSRTVPYAVTDGNGGRTQGAVALVVLGDGDQVRKPQTQPDVIRGVVGKPIQVEPLGNDVPGADPDDPQSRMRLASEIRGTGALQVDTNLDTGVVTLTGTTPGTFELAYGAQVGAGVSSGRIRVDIEESADPDAPPVAVPDTATVREQSPVLVDVLANDYSPRADVLVTQAATVSSDNAWLRPSIYKGRWVRVEALDPLNQPNARTGTVSYTVSDGTKSATGQIAVTQKPAIDALPVVEDDTAVVRAGDTVTINALDNDSMAEGIPLVLDPTSVKVLGSGVQQTAFASGSVVRYVPDVVEPTAEVIRTIEYAVYPVGQREKAQTGRITVTIKPLPSQARLNLPPVARSFTASVTAGETLPITVPTSGVDPDGDSVTLLGLTGTDGQPLDLELGRVTTFGATTITYEAYPTSAGTEQLTYEVTDRFGGTSTGFVRIGVVPPADPQPPVAVEDEVRAAPGKTVSVDVTENDLIARGDSVSLEYEDLNEPSALEDWKVDPALTQFSTEVPDKGVKQLTYGITNGLFDPSRSTVAVVAVPGFKNPPVAVDDVAKPGAGETSTVVDVLANDRDIDSAPGSLTVKEVLSPDATVEGNKVRVKVLDHPHVVPYVVEDDDEATAMALIYVPTGSNGIPTVITSSLIEMDQDSSTTVDLADYVVSTRDREVGVTSADTLSASPQGDLKVELDGGNGLKLTSGGGYNGPASVMLEVTDKTAEDQTDFGTAYVSIPVQIGPKVPLLRCPSYAVSLTAGGRAREFDIPTLCRAWLPQGLSLDDVAFEASWQTQPEGVDLEVTDNRRVSLTPGERAPSSTAGRLQIKARGSSQPPVVVGVSVVALPQPRVRPFRIPNLEAGQSTTFDLRPYLESPLQEVDCTVVRAQVASGKGLSVQPSGCGLTVTASQEASGDGVVDVVMQDAPDRLADGRGSITLLGFPGVPRSVSAVADRVNGGSARVSFSPPAYDGGVPISGYLVRYSGGSSGERTCTASPCTIDQLVDGEAYTFTVAAVNGVGEGDPSAATAPVTPDTKPNPVNGLRPVSRGDRTFTIAWQAPPKKGSDVATYRMRVTDTVTGTVKEVNVTAPTTQSAVSGLVNNNEQQVQVRAYNGAGAGPFGTAIRYQSAGTPKAVAAPRIEPRAPGTYSESQVLISWDATDPNGPPLTGYTVYRRLGAGGWQEIGRTAANQRSFTDTVDYDGRTYGYAVGATNGGGNSSQPTNSTPYKSVAPPITPDQPRVTTPRNDKTADVVVQLNDPRGRGYTTLAWRSDGGSGNVDCSDCGQGAAKSFRISGVGINAQNLQVKVSNGDQESDWSPASNAFTPYGPPNPPSSGSSSANNRRITYSWGPAEYNGRSVTAYRVAGDGVSQRDQGPSNRSIAVDYPAWSTSYSITVRTIDAEGQVSGARTISGRTEAEPPPPDPETVKLVKGARCPAGGCHTSSGSCTSSSCAYLKVEWSALKSGRTCHFTNSFGEQPGWQDLSIGSGSGSKQSINYFGFPGRQVYVNCGGLRDSLTW